ncbi:MAG TPA: DUF928 domain-containing protein [Humisphaera sp.]|nr:DUF928 domain-containing protein [Humisphaera sp.]
MPNVMSAPSDLGTATSRGHVNDPNLAASVVAPQANEGLTTQESPSLFWYTTKPTTAKIEIDLVKADDLNDVKPLVKVVFHDPMIGGLQRLNLAKAGVKLQPNVRYKWSVSLIDPEGRSGDIISQAIIRRVPAPEKLASSLAQTADASDRTALYAEAGIWYDMLGGLCDAIDAHPGDAQLREERAALLTQAGLPVLPKELKNWASGTAPK